MAARPDSVCMMDRKNQPSDEEIEIPEDGTVIKQVQYAWLWSSMPWLVVIAVLFLTDLIVAGDPIIGSVAAIIILVPRYIGWRRTAYVLTDDSLIYQHGGLTGHRRFQIPISSFRDVRARYGFFGRSLGYQSVDVTLENQKVFSLAYVPILADVAERIREVMDPSAAEPETDGAPEEPGDHDPDVSRYDPENSPEDKPPAQ